MSNVVQNQINYLPTESELRQIFGASMPDAFIRDYTSVKRNVLQASQAVDENTTSVAALTIRVNTIDGQIITISGQLNTLSGQVLGLTTQVTTINNTLSAHISAQSAHGAIGDIVGTDDYATASVGGTVLLAAAQVDAVVSTVAVTAPNASAAPATYTQAQMAEVVTLVNELKADLTQTVADLNAAIAVINGSLSTERTAKQRAV